MSRQLRVSNLPSRATVDLLTNYFESPRQFGNVQVVDVQINGTYAVVTFDNEADVDCVLKKHSREPCMLSKCTLDIRHMTTGGRNTHDHFEREPIYSDDFEDETDIIEVRGFSETVSEDLLCNYFENKFRSGGGPIEDFTKTEDYVHIKYRDSAVISRVLSKSHKVEGCELHVKSLIISRNSLLLTSVPASTTAETLENYLEGQLNCEVDVVTFSHDQTKAVVDFKCNIDLEQAKKVCRERPLMRTHIAAEAVPITTSMVVTGVRPSHTQESVLYYFENKNKSGGGTVEQVEMFTDEGFCLVHFQCPEDLTSVCSKGQHVLSGISLKVKPYHRCLGAPSGDGKAKPVIPGPLEMSPQDTQKLKITARRGEKKTEIDSKVASVHGQIDWNENPLRITCMLTDTVDGCRALASKWCDTIRKTLAVYTDELEIQMSAVSIEVWKEAKGRLEGHDVKDPDRTSLVHENGELVLVAPKHDINDVWTRIQTAVGHAEKSIKRRSEVETAEFVLQHRWQMEYLQAVNFSDEVKHTCEHVRVNYDTSAKKVVFTGPRESIPSAKVSMFDLIHNADTLRMNVKHGKRKMIKKQAVNELLKQRMHDQGLVCALEITDDTIIIHGKEDHGRKAQNILNNMLADITIPFSPNVLPLFNSSTWDKFETDLREKYHDCLEIHISRDAMKIEVHTLDDHTYDVREKINEFLQNNAVITKREDLREVAVVKYMEKYNRHEVEKGIGKCRCHPKYKFEGSTVVITGTEEDVEHLRRMFTEMADGVHSKHHKKCQIGIQRFLTCSVGRECLEKLETSKRCIIQVVGGEAKRSSDREGARSDPQPTRSYSGSGEVTINGNVKIKVMRGDLTEQRKDVIVVTASRNLHFRGRLHDKILANGGREIKSDCDSRIKRKGQLRDGDVYLGSGGDLPCKAIAHAVIAQWDSGSGETRTLVSVVENCLQKCDKRGFSSIVIPGLGTGQLHYPTQVACKTIIATIQSYFEKASSTAIRKVVLCDMNGETLKTFEECLEKRFGHLEKRATREDHGESRGRDTSWDESRSETPRASNGLRIGRAQVKVVIGHLAKEKVDVIVDSAPADLHLKKGKCSKALLDAGGYRIQQECKDKYPQGISPGEVAVTTGGKLNCEKLFHITLKQYNKAEHDEAIDGLRSSVKTCLELADTHSFASIAIPSAGTGSMKYPSSVVAREMFASVTRYLKSNRRSALTSVRLVVFPGDAETVKAFQDEEKKQSSKEDPDDVEVVYSRDDQPIEVKCQGSKVVMVQAYLAKEKVDVIVNSTSQDLKLDRGQASKAILKAAGPGIQQECGQNYSGGITVGQVAVTSPGNLSCKKLFHIGMPPFERDGGEGCMQGLADTISQCLAEADKLGFKSLSIPPIGIGALKYPKGWVAGKMFSCIEKYFQANAKSTVTTVRIVVFPNDMEVFQAFKREAFKRMPDTGDGGGDKQRRQANVASFMSKEKHECVLKIYSDRRGNIDEVARAFDAAVEREWCSKEFVDKEVIPTLHFNQVKSIKEDFKQNSVFAHIDVESGCIIAYGLAKNLLDVSNKVDSILRKQHKFLSTKREAKLARNIVRWYYLVNQKEVPFGDVDSMNMEKSYQKKDTQFQVKNRAGQTFVIDFQKMHSFESSQPNQTSLVIRRDTIADATGSVPSNWTKGNASDTVTLVPLAQGSQEYTNVLAEFTKTLGRNPNIIKIERVQNKTLYIQYDAKLRSINLQNKSKNNVKVLWHGTGPDIVPSIYTNGFNRSYSNVCAIGNGVYFAVNAQYSDGGYSRPDSSGHKRMFRCLVITGQTTQGQSGMRVPPQRTTVGGAPVLYDSVTNSPGNPSMYVIFHDSQAYPEHLITYV